MYHHSFEHAFHYPSIPHASPIAPAASAAAEAGAAAAAASHAPHFRPGLGMMYSHYHPHAFRFRRFGMFRRFFWVCHSRPSNMQTGHTEETSSLRSSGLREPSAWRALQHRTDWIKLISSSVLVPP